MSALVEAVARAIYAEMSLVAESNLPDNWDEIGPDHDIARAEWSKVAVAAINAIHGQHKIVPLEIWETAFACFAARCGAEMMNRKEWPEIWAEVFRFECDDSALARLGIPARAAIQEHSTTPPRNAS